ncbi:MAG: FtsX-like permease family protein, partial [Gemmatimonadaceae bacterium]
ALVIAALGLFAVVSYLVNQRTREIGVRLALGGGRNGIARLVVGDALAMTAVGAGAGILVALVGAPLIQPLLFETSARDPASLALSAGTLLVVTIAAALFPARRASNVDPVVALRQDG